MPPVIGTATGSDWSSVGALLTFYFPIVLFLIIATCLYLEFSRPHTVPGLRAAKLAAATQAPAAGQSKGEKAPPPFSEADSSAPGERTAARTDHAHEEPSTGT
jgi:hypothetical protein